MDAGFGIYVHWPFCAAKCPYCDFNSHVRHGGIDQARYAAAFVRELAHAAEGFEGRRVDSVFFGGGTPSLMAPETVDAILGAIGRQFALADDAEITLEANPTSVEAGRFAAYRSSGVNRVSLGVQALNDTDLKTLGRLHTAAEALDAVDIANRTFDRVSFDMIYARPGQTVAAWEGELTRALAFGPSHLPLYQLTIEPETPFGALHRAGRLVVPDADAGAVAGCCAASSAVQSSMSDILRVLSAFWLLTTHWAWGRSLPTAPPKIVGTPWARRMATALA